MKKLLTDAVAPAKASGTINRFAKRNTIFLLISAFCLLIITTACKPSVTEYNDAVVNILDQNSTAIENTSTAYNSSIPNLVTEKTEIDSTEMEATLDEARTAISNSEEILLLESRSTEQQTAVQEEFANYLELADTYLAAYEEMVQYYESGSYQDDPAQVSEYDSGLFDEDNLFDSLLESNNTLAEILESFL